MPIYEYQCKNCGKVSEFLVGVVQEETDIKCKYCQSKDLNKIFSRSFAHIAESKNEQSCCSQNESCKVSGCLNEKSCKG